MTSLVSIPELRRQADPSRPGSLVIPADTLLALVEAVEATDEALDDLGVPTFDPADREMYAEMLANHGEPLTRAAAALARFSFAPADPAETEKESV